MLNIEFQPIVSARNYAPTRTFVTKWDVEIENTRTKKMSRSRERDTKYFNIFDSTDFELPVTNDGESHAGLRTHAENAYYDRNHRNFIDWYEVELDTDQATPCNKRYIDFEDQSLFKRSRA